MRSTILTASLSDTWELLDDHGYSPEVFFQEAGIDPDALERPDGRINIDRAIELWLTVDKLFNDPCLGLKLAKYWHPTNFQALGYAWISSKTLRDALNRLYRYEKILSEGLIIDLSEDAGHVTVDMDFAFELHPVVQQLLATALTAVILLMCRVNYGKKLNPLSVTFKHAEPECSGDYFEFFKTNVNFGSDRDSLTFSKEVLDKALVGQNPQMAQYADKVAMRYLAKLDKSDIANRVKAEIVELLPSGEVTTKNIAKKLYVSERSLSRKLNESGTSFRNILNKTRKDMASHYLKDGNIDMVEISYLLGYGDYTAFFKAYKRWTGHSPSRSAQ